MKTLYAKIVGILVLLSLFWLQAERGLLSYANFFQYRSALVQYSGILAIVLITMVMILALRLPWIEKLTCGLDKSYQLHKKLGISALITASVHWLIAIVPKYLVSWNVLEKPVRIQHTVNPDSLYAIIRPLRSGAESIGEWAFYAMLLLGVVSLLGVVGYKVFKLSHKLMALCYLVLAYHSVILIKHSYWPYMITYVVIAIVLCGIVSAVWSLSGMIGKKRTYQAQVSTFSFDRDNHVTDLRLSVQGWPGHHQGQFAYVNFAGEEPHPFTIANVADSNGQLRFLIKELGDFTQVLKSRLTTGQTVKVEGPYGQFDFADDRNQIWIGGGIGIAAFKAALQQRQIERSNQNVTLYYCTNNPSPSFIAELESEASKGQVELKVIDGRRTPLLNVELLLMQHQNLHDYSIWFCGPAVFSNQLKLDLKSVHYDLTLFHHEYFSMR